MKKVIIILLLIVLALPAFADKPPKDRKPKREKGVRTEKEQKKFRWVLVAVGALLIVQVYAPD